MHLETTMLDGQILKIAPDGRFDLEGTNEIDMQFTMLTTTQRVAVLVDMTDVSFLASIGMRLLLSCAQGCAAKGGKLVLYNPQPMVEKVLQTSGVAAMIPVFADLEAARAALQGVAAE